MEWLAMITQQVTKQEDETNAGAIQSRRLQEGAFCSLKDIDDAQAAFLCLWGAEWRFAFSIDAYGKR